MARYVSPAPRPNASDRAYPLAAAGFDFASSEVHEAPVCQLLRREFHDDAPNVVLIGGPGTGKTHVAYRPIDLCGGRSTIS